MKAIILCAGKGERLQPLTNTIPKPMIPINNRPLLEYNILLCKKHGITEIAVNTSYLPEQIKEYFGDGSKFGVKIKYSFEPELIGTSGALNNFREFLDETFAVIYGDNLTDIDLTEMYKYHKQNNAIATTAVRNKPAEYKTQSLILADENKRIIKFLEKPSEELVQSLVKDTKIISSGLYILEPEILNFIPEGYSDFAYDIFPKLIKNGKSLFAFIMDKYHFREVGKIEKYELAKKEIESGEVKLSFLESNKAVFLDRDGVINEILYEPEGKLMSPCNLEQLKILPKVKEGIQMLKDQGFKIVTVSNQPGVAFGYLNKEKLEEINKFLKEELGIDETYNCPHHPKFTGDCDCRKPKVGLIEQAAKEFNIDVKNSYMAGDNISDIQMGQTARVKKTFRIGAERADIMELQHKKGIFPDFTSLNLIDVAEKIKEIESN